MTELLTIHLKSGDRAELRGGHFKVVRNGLGGLTRIEWEGGCEPQLLHFDVDQIALMTVADEASPGKETP